MTPLDLDAIRAHLEMHDGCSKWDAHELIAEVERLRADSVPRSALVQVGWLHDGETLTGWRADDTDRCQPVYVIRENADA